MTNTPSDLDIRALIAARKAEIAQSPAEAFIAAIPEEPEEGVLDFPADDGQGMALRSFVAQDSVLAAQEAAIKDRRTQLKKAIKLLAGDSSILKVGGEKVGTVSTSYPVRLNTTLVAELFPVEKYPDLYHAPKPEVRFTADPKFKSDAISAASMPPEVSP